MFVPISKFSLIWSPVEVDETAQQIFNEASVCKAVDTVRTVIDQIFPSYGACCLIGKTNQILIQRINATDSLILSSILSATVAWWKPRNVP